MAYLPREVTAGFLREGYANHMGDMEVSMWHYQRVTHDVPVCWDVRPVHLHYNPPIRELEEMR
jgi:hypothetical protein